MNCHSFDTPNTILGPSLYDVGKRRDETYIREKILDPDKIVVAGFPKGVMKATLAGVDFFNDVKKNPGIVDSLVQYLSGLKGEATDTGDGSKKSTQAAPAVVMPDFRLNDEELHNVVTFLLGLQEHTVEWPQKSFAKPTATPQSASATEGATFVGKSGEELVKLAGCNACHKFDGPERLVGPSLWDIGARQDKDYIRESIIDPDKVVVAGYPAEVMKVTLTGTGFYQKVSLEALEKIIDYLTNLKGS
jgi:cytochrome c2